MLSEYYKLRSKAILSIKHALTTEPFIDLTIGWSTETLPTVTDIKGVKFNLVLLSEDGCKGETEKGQIAWFMPKDLALFDLCIIAEIVST